jgi:hydrogenase maturation factor
MVVAVPPEAADAAIGILAESGVAACLVGEVVATEALGGRRYVEERLQSAAG